MVIFSKPFQASAEKDLNFFTCFFVILILRFSCQLPPFYSLRVDRFYSNRCVTSFLQSNKIQFHLLCLLTSVRLLMKWTPAFRHQSTMCPREFLQRELTWCSTQASWLVVIARTTVRFFNVFVFKPHSKMVVASVLENIETSLSYKISSRSSRFLMNPDLTFSRSTVTLYIRLVHFRGC